MPLTIELEPKLEERLREIAALNGCSQSEYVRELIEDDLYEMEWADEILRISEGVRSGEIKTYTLDEVREELGI